MTAAVLWAAVVVGAPAGVGRAEAGARRQAEPAVSYVPPVLAPVSDPFRPPANPYGPGNRGLEYATSAGDEVRAAGDGVVVFAGSVGGSRHVTLRHADGLRTSYSFLATIAVSPNEVVRQGSLIGTAGGVFHFGVRDPTDTYLDPALLFSGRLRLEVHLIPGPDDGDGRPAARVREVRALQRIGSDRFAAAAAFGARVAGELGQGWRLRWQSAINLTAPSHVASLARSMQGWYLQRHRCTPARTTPPRPSGRRIVVLVAGIGSSSETASVDRVDVAGLGYAKSDVVRFSYRGGRTPGALPPGSGLAGVPITSYRPADTERDLGASAAELHALLAEIAAANPGVPIDVVAHSQGGVVSRLALAQGPPPAELQTLVTLGTPHHGANLATAVAAARLDGRLGAVMRAAHQAGYIDLDPDGRSAAQLAEGSATIDAMNRSDLPASVRVTSIGARGDLTVPAPRTIVGDGSTSTVVTVDGLDAHGDLPGSPAAHREIALAVAGAPPTCRSFQHALADAVGSEVIDVLEDDLTATAAWAPVLIGPAPAAR